MQPGKEQIKRIRKLQQKKYRKAYGLFTVERWKNIRAFLEAGFRPRGLWAVRAPDFPADVPWQEIDYNTLQKMSALQRPYDALAVFPLPQYPPPEPEGLILALDDIQDPGNLGTLIRTADWFGIRQILCSPGSADAFNPKTVQAAMGSLARVRVYDCDLADWLAGTDLPVWAADMEGADVYDVQFPGSFVLLLGNEGHGIGRALRPLVQKTIRIPRHPGASAESLNVSVAGSIVMAEWFRRRRTT